MNVGNRIRAVILVAVMLMAVGALTLPGVSAGEDVRDITPHNNMVASSGDIFKMDLSGVGVVVKSAGVWYAWAHDQEVEKAAAIVAAAERAKKAKAIAPVQHANVQRSGGVNTGSYSGPDCQYAGLIRSIWGQDAEWAISIAMRESRCTAGAASHTGCLGVFQICWPLHDDIEQAVCGRSDRDGMFDPECNIRQAWHLYQGSGRQPWHL